MIALKIINVKNFMAKLLTQDVFQNFLLEEASITTYNTFVIDGHLMEAFYDTEEWKERSHPEYELSEWSVMPPICFDLIKGKHTPLSFRLTLHLKPELMETVLDMTQTDVFPSQMKSFVLNIRYDRENLVLTSATAFQTFLMDKTLDMLWDTYLRKFLDTQEIEYEDMV